jgi:coenzyme F420-reducing hydrogenase beta subunit
MEMNRLHPPIELILDVLNVDISQVKKTETKDQKLIIKFTDGHSAEFTIHTNCSSGNNYEKKAHN